jgi:NADH-quinone oxidoreductase subunit K
MSLTVGAAMFTIGLAGLMVRRNAMVMLMCIELMVNAANLNLVALAAQYGRVDAQALVLFIMGVEAAELAAALAVVTAFQRLSGHHDLSRAGELRD